MQGGGREEDAVLLRLGPSGWAKARRIGRLAFPDFCRLRPAAVIKLPVNGWPASDLTGGEVETFAPNSHRFNVSSRLWELPGVMSAPLGSPPKL